MRTPIIPLAISVLLYCSGCHSSTSDQRVPGKDTILVDPSNPQLPEQKHNPEFRTQVKKEPVVEYREKTGHILGDFTVKMYQTNKTQDFRAEVEFEGLPGTDTMRFPDFGKEPQLVLKKGNTKYSCIVGFLDNDSLFRELKLVYITPKGNQLKITRLKHWVVMDHYRLVSQ